MGLKAFFKELFKHREPEDTADVEALRIDFKERYHHFKLLLNANSNALSAMADMEKALSGSYPFSMSFVRSRCTQVSVNVFQMIQHIEKLAPEKYPTLRERFIDIRHQVDSVFKAEKQIPDKRLVIPFKDIHRDMADIVGNKMANLGEIRNKTHFSVPPGFALSTFACEEFFEHNGLQTEIDRKLQAVDGDDLQVLYQLSSEIQQLINRSRIPEDLQEAVREAWQELTGNGEKKIKVALRSSALGEDAAGSSFAGQYLSALNVGFEDFFDAYKEVVASKYGLPAMSYRLSRGIRDEDVLMSVGCMVMVEAVSGGVAYSRNPVDMDDDGIFINAVWGLPKSVVDGSTDCDILVVSRDSPRKIIHSSIADKAGKYVCYPEEGVCRMDLTEDDRRWDPSVTDDQAISLAGIAVSLEEYYGFPVDMEWALDPDGNLFVLQCRPLMLKEKTGEMLPEDEDDEKQKAVIVKGGITASPGAAWGVVHKVEKGADVLRFPQDAVLVTAQALPRWAPLINRAAAVITGQGGFAGHLANVTREFGVPGLYGVSGILEKVNNGEMITVDADRRTVYRGKVDVPRSLAPAKSAMAGSPVYEILRQAFEPIVPLNLLDPDSRDFTASNCRTLHDITRFIHEKSVQEMFNFGREHHFPERSSKQLFYNVPMQWWILNLDDGFSDEINGKYVRLENIACVPMLAFWEGFATIPWEGPPALDSGGFASVMFRATANTALTTGVRTKYSDRNYFMISKNFCSLSSRLGFHFSILEALVSHRMRENYISFQFKGGAANFERKLKRVVFIGEILEKFGFRVDIHEDNLVSRIEGREEAYMLSRMKILGYLTLHTRQLDMIMTNPNRVAYYRSKIENDIERLIKSG
jgi:pyruvate, water dikinase